MTQYDRMLIFGASFKYFMVFWNDMQAGSVRCKGDPLKLKDVGHDSITSSAHQSKKYAHSHTQKKSWKQHQIKGKQPFPVGKYVLMCFDVPLVLFCFYSGGGSFFTLVSRSFSLFYCLTENIYWTWAKTQLTSLVCCHNNECVNCNDSPKL